MKVGLIENKGALVLVEVSSSSTGNVGEPKNPDLFRKSHKLKNRSSFTVVVLRSLRHKACVCCGAPINSLEESYKHWDENLKKQKEAVAQNNI